MTIDIRQVKTRSQLKAYIFLPEKLYKGNAHWVPPLYSDEWNFHNPKENNALTYCDTLRLLAFQNNKAVGRIMGIVHHHYNQEHGEKVVRFFHFDCINDPAVSKALLNAIETWGKEKGMTKCIGPYGFSDKDPQGLQIEGFNYLPIIATPTNPPYLKNLIETEGYTKELDCLSYHMPIPHQLAPLHERIYQRIANNPAVKVVTFTSSKTLKPYIIPVLQLVNEAYAHIFGFTALTEPEMKKFAAQYLPVLDPHFVKVVVNNQNTVLAFVVAMPDMSPGLQKARGRLFPFGFIHVLRAMKKTTQLNLLLGAIKPGYRNLGLNVLMAKAMFDSCRQRGLTIMDSHLILESNLPMRGECEKLDGKIVKRYRVYHKWLN